LTSINDWGVAVGTWTAADGTPQGFVRHADGSITDIAASGGFANINDLGEASGVTSNFASGLLLQLNGRRVIWAPPQGTINVNLAGLNIEGSVAFFGALPDGFVRHADGRLTTISPSAPTYNRIHLGSINNHGTVAGFENGLGPVQGFAQFANGTRALVNAPVANQQYSQPTAINDRNVVTGSWLDTGALYHGFAATVVSCD